MHSSEHGMVHFQQVSRVPWESHSIKLQKRGIWYRCELVTTHGCCWQMRPRWRPRSRSPSLELDSCFCYVHTGPPSQPSGALERGSREDEVSPPAEAGHSAWPPEVLLTLPLLPSATSHARPGRSPGPTSSLRKPVALGRGEERTTSQAAHCRPSREGKGGDGAGVQEEGPVWPGT